MTLVYGMLDDYVNIENIKTFVDFLASIHFFNTYFNLSQDDLTFF